MAKEVKFPVEAFLVRLYCDCGAEMLPTGNVHLTSPPQYPHLCTGEGCDKTSFPRKRYPWVEHKEKPHG